MVPPFPIGVRERGISEEQAERPPGVGRAEETGVAAFARRVQQSGSRCPRQPDISSDAILIRRLGPVRPGPAM